MKDPLESLIIRTRRSFYKDGLWELMAGCLSIYGSLILKISPQTGQGAIIFAGGVLAIFILYSTLKNKLVIPRSGYAVYKGQGLRAHIIVIIKRAVLLLALGAIFVILKTQNENSAQVWLVFLLGIFIGIGWVWQGLRLRMARLLLIGIISLFLGAALSPLLPWSSIVAISVYDRLGWYFLLLGITFLVSGGLTFLNFLRTPWSDGENSS